MTFIGSVCASLLSRGFTHWGHADCWERFKPCVGADLKLALGEWLARLVKAWPRLPHKEFATFRGEKMEKERHESQEYV